MLAKVLTCALIGLEGAIVEVEVDVARIAVKPGDRFLLCSDGLCGYLGDVEIREVLEREPPPRAARILVDRANAKGGYDNVTVQVLAIPDTAPLGGDVADETEVSLPPCILPPAASMSSATPSERPPRRSVFQSTWTESKAVTKRSNALAIASVNPTAARKVKYCHMATTMVRTSSR